MVIVDSAQSSPTPPHKSLLSSLTKPHEEFEAMTSELMQSFSMGQQQQQLHISQESTSTSTNPATNTPTNTSPSTTPTAATLPFTTVITNARPETQL
jgi:hypothetical protein